MELEHRDIHGLEEGKKKKKNLNLRLKSYTKINSKWFTDLNLKFETPKVFLIGEHLRELMVDNKFLDLTLKSIIHKGKLDKLDFIRIINLCSMKILLKKIYRLGECFQTIYATKNKYLNI